MLNRICLSFEKWNALLYYICTKGIFAARLPHHHAISNCQSHLYKFLFLQNGNFALSVSNFMKLVKRCTQLVCNYTFRLYERANAPLHLTYFANRNKFWTHNFLAMALLIHLHVFKMNLLRKENVFLWQGKYFVLSFYDTFNIKSITNQSKWP